MASNFGYIYPSRVHYEASLMRQRLLMPITLSLMRQEVQVTITNGIQFENATRSDFENANYIIDEAHSVCNPNDLPILIMDEVLDQKKTLLEFPTKKCKDTFDCPICFESREIYYELECQHLFCYICLDNWYYEENQKTCPLCRADLNPKKSIDSID